MKPVALDLLNLGNDNDPCFGKLYSIKADECRRCGDSEFCQIKMAQSIHLITATQEKKHAFKDKQEAEFVDNQNKEMVDKLVKRAKKKPGIWLRLERVIPKFLEEYNLPDKEADILTQRIIREIQATKKLRLNKQLTKYRYE